MKEALFIL